MAERDHLGVQIEHINKAKSGLDRRNYALRDCHSLDKFLFKAASPIVK
jgi:hypothetical protein